MNKVNTRKLFSFAGFGQKAKGLVAGFIMLSSAGQFNPAALAGYTNAAYNSYKPRYDYYQPDTNRYDSNPTVFQSEQYYGGDPRNYVAQGQRYGAYLTPEQAALRFHDRNFDFRFDNTNKDMVTPLTLQPIGYNPYDYYQYSRSARWRYGQPAHKMVVYQNMYPNVDVAYQGDQRRFGYDFWVRPGGNPNNVVLAFNNVGQVNVAPNGELVLVIDGRQLRCARPSVYQNYNGARQTVPVNYRAYPDNRVGFDFGQYDPNQNLYMDPIYFDPIY
ncbi:MAG: hypothetical protein WCT32_04070 [Patescibacteria group bacterium]|jgi:hypothetical protein